MFYHFKTFYISFFGETVFWGSYSEMFTGSYWMLLINTGSSSWKATPYYHCTITLTPIIVHIFYELIEISILLKYNLYSIELTTSSFVPLTFLLLFQTQLILKKFYLMHVKLENIAAETKDVFRLAGNVMGMMTA